MKGSHTYLHSLFIYKGDAAVPCSCIISYTSLSMECICKGAKTRKERCKRENKTRHTLRKESITQGKGGCRISKFQRPPIYIRRRERHYTIELRITLPPDWALNRTLHHMQKALFGRRNKGFIRSIIEKNANFLNLAARFVNNFHALHI